MTRPTPLTDALVNSPRKTLKGSYEYMVLHARTLERERDELVEALDRAHSRLLTFDTMANSGKHDNIPAQDDLIEPIVELLAKHSKGTV